MQTVVSECVSKLFEHAVSVHIVYTYELSIHTKKKSKQNSLAVNITRPFNKCCAARKKTPGKNKANEEFYFYVDI